MSDALRAVTLRYEELAREAQTLAFLPRGIELQETVCLKIKEFLRELEVDKVAAAGRGDEEDANTVLSMEVALQTVLHQLMMWIDLKRDDPDSAWGHLVDAQLACEAAIRVKTRLPAKPQTTRLENL